MVKLRAGRGAYATVLTKYIRPRQRVPQTDHRSDIVLLDKQNGTYTFCFREDNDSGNEEAQIFHASCRYVKIVKEGNLMLLFNKDEEPSIPWEKLEAKKLLSFKYIINGLVPLDSKRGDNTNTMSLKEIYSMRPEYAEYNYKTFSG